MSTIQHLFNSSIVIRRLKATTGSKRSFVSTGTIDAHVRRVDTHTDQAAIDVYGATHKAYVDISSDIDEGDEILVSGVRYAVVTVIQKEPGLAINEHQEIMLRKFSS